MNPKQRSRGRGNNGGNPNRGNYNGGGGGGGGHGGGMPRHINVRTQVFDSNGPEGRIRGNAHQVMEKYLALARDASSQGDRVAAENFYQHAEHYFRLINAYNQNNGQRRPQNLPTPAGDQNEMVGDEEEGEDNGGNAQGEGMSGDDMAIAAAPAPMMPVEQPELELTPVEEAPQPVAEKPERPARRPRRPRQPAAAAAEGEEKAPSTEPVSA